MKTSSRHIYLRAKCRTWILLISCQITMLLYLGLCISSLLIFFLEITRRLLTTFYTFLLMISPQWIDFHGESYYLKLLWVGRFYTWATRNVGSHSSINIWDYSQSQWNCGSKGIDDASQHQELHGRRATIHFQVGKSWLLFKPWCKLSEKWTHHVLYFELLTIFFFEYLLNYILKFVTWAPWKLRWPRRMWMGCSTTSQFNQIFHTTTEKTRLGWKG